MDNITPQKPDDLLFDIAKAINFKGTLIGEISDNKIIQIADALLNGQLSSDYESHSPLLFDPTRIEILDWGFQNVKATNTFLLHAYGLRHVYFLSRAYLKSHDLRYLNLAWEFILSYHNHLISKDQKSLFIYNDHAVVERTENLVYFGHVAQESNFKSLNTTILKDLISDCCDFLQDDQNYQFNHNHGILSDKGLIIGAYCLNNAYSVSRIDHAIFRLKTQIEFAYFPDGVHVENSTDYHIAISNELRTIANCLNFLNYPYAKEITAILEKTFEFLVYAYKPNLQRPLFGDSKGNKGQKAQNIETHNHPNLNFIKNLGKEGMIPSKRIAYFPNSGYVFLREHFEPAYYHQSTWVSLKAGYATRIHKHQDDLSVCLYSKGYDIFIDAGLFNYMPGNKYKTYMESIPAHTTIGIVENSYSIAKVNGEDFIIQIVEHLDDYDHVLASSRVYDDCAIYRHIYYFREQNILIIRDEVFADRPKLFAQYFHLGPQMSTIVVDPLRSVFRIGDSGFSIVMRQLNKIDNIRILDGTATQPMSLLSTGFSEFMNTRTIQYTKLTEHFEFITAIEIKPSYNTQIKDQDAVSLDKNVLLVGLKAIALIPNIPVDFMGVDVTCKKLTLILYNHLQTGINRQFALYIYDHQSRENIAKIPYTSDESIRYTFPALGDYDLLYYVSNNRNEKIKGIIATIRQEAGKLKLERVYKPMHVPKVEPIIVCKQEGLEYLFEIPVQYDFPFQTRWWVYREGINITCVNLPNTKEFGVRFVDPGDYVIMCSVSDAYFGEFYFTQSDIIHID